MKDLYALVALGLPLAVIMWGVAIMVLRIVWIGLEDIFRD